MARGESRKLMHSRPFSLRGGPLKSRTQAQSWVRQKPPEGGLPADHRWMSGFSRSALVDIVKSRLKAELQQRRGALSAAWFVNENGMNAKAVQAGPFTTTLRPCRGQLAIRRSLQLQPKTATAQIRHPPNLTRDGCKKTAADPDRAMAERTIGYFIASIESQYSRNRGPDWHGRLKNRLCEPNNNLNISTPN